MIRYLLSCLIAPLALFCACTPYNSSEQNKQFLQGKWFLISQTYYHPDSTKNNLLRDTLYLTFNNDFITENINQEYEQRYTYNIKRYDINWYIDNKQVSVSRIIKLNEDTFVMKTISHLWTYKKIK